MAAVEVALDQLDGAFLRRPPSRRPFFVRRIEIRTHEKDGDRLDPDPLQFLREGFDGAGIERHQHVAVRVYPLGLFETQLARDQGLVPPVVQVEGVGPVGARFRERRENPPR